LSTLPDYENSVANTSPSRFVHLPEGTGLACLAQPPKTPSSASESDIWSGWLLHARHGGDPALQQIVRAELHRYAERVLDGAQLCKNLHEES
jgi:hypothetical protein